MTEREFTESMKQRLEKGYILPGQMETLYSAKETAAKLLGRRCAAFCALAAGTAEFPEKGRYFIQTKAIPAYNNSFELLVKDLKRYKKQGYSVLLISGSRTRAKRLAEDLLLEGLNSFYSEDCGRVVKPGEIMAFYGKLKRGYEYPLISFAVISESDIFGQKKRKKKRHRTYEGDKINSFSELAVGDYVVHENHGLGIYRGIEQIEVDKTLKD